MIEHLDQIQAAAQAAIHAHPEAVQMCIDALKWLGKNSISILTGLGKLRQYLKERKAAAQSKAQPPKPAAGPAAAPEQEEQRPAA